MGETALRSGPARQRSAGTVPVRFAGAGPRYLLLRAYRHWDFPKGLIEPGEMPLEAALRETREESGLTDLRLAWGERWRETPPYGRGKVARYYLVHAPEGDVHLPVNPELGRPEHHEHRWLAFEAARGLLVPRLAAILDWAHATVTETGEPQA